MGNSNIKIKKVIGDLDLYIGLIIIIYEKGNIFERILQGKFSI